ncbi:MAG: triphosphoribosyl-dephospho-CoA synthetase [Gemmataceae bacterium]|nr:triphosphoribosyl-dephospho-CoA synthetase [Gemmataceae bacterium]
MNDAERSRLADISLLLCLKQACIWEARARKAGNVHPDANFEDLTYQHFVSSGYVSSRALVAALNEPLGSSILRAIRATRGSVPTNTNLGIVLLLAPLSKIQGEHLRAGVRDVLAHTTIEDSEQVFEAIRIASPGGLGEAKEQDVRDTPTLPLRDIMALAADRDLIARQYANGFQDVFDLGVPALLDGWARFGEIEPAIQHCQLVWLANHPDSLILRKRGPEIAEVASRQASAILELGSIGTLAGREAYAEFDGWLRADGHARNPGTTADLIAACLFVAFRERTISLGSSLLPEALP